jgi:hypothetical protein
MTYFVQHLTTRAVLGRGFATAQAASDAIPAGEFHLYAIKRAR